jgi:hypothetical protein
MNAALTATMATTAPTLNPRDSLSQDAHQPFRHNADYAAFSEPEVHPPLSALRSIRRAAGQAIPAA